MLFIRRLSIAKAKHVRGLLRAGGYVAALSLVLGAFQLRAAHAEVKNRTVELGRQMLQLANATQHDVNKLTLNGQPMWIGSSLATDSVTTVLDRYEDDCREEHRAARGELARARQRRSTRSKRERPGMSTGIMRGGDRPTKAPSSASRRARARSPR